MNTWAKEAIFYHIYPIGFCGAEKSNNFKSVPQPRLTKILDWAGHIRSLGANAVYLGPLFESSSHGYDTVDYYQVDRRLGDNNTFKKVASELRERGIRVVVDGVFNHVGREFWAFKDVLQKGEKSRYCSWFSNLQFGKKSPYHDPFSYDAWNGYYNLVKLNVNHPEVREHLFKAVRMWIEDFGIDGIRLDCADCLDLDFLRELSRFCKTLKEDFWLMGEVVHGDYNRWVNENTLDSTTNYECYKGLYSSHNDKNYFEIAYSLNRQFGEEHGIYKNLWLYSFVDNHDVNRISSTLKNPAHLHPLHVLLFTMPGIPSIYYGSEWGIQGVKGSYSDHALRPELDLKVCPARSPQKDLEKTISRLASIRQQSKALKYGRYEQIKVNHEQLVFARIAEDECMIVAVNASDQPMALEFALPAGVRRLEDILNSGEAFSASENRCCVTLPSCWGRILRVAS
ncbi:MAG: alpha-amylase family glycosyl hydrolase [Clostridia bacterium]|nr:alpha-amylase family glycosyl hydrolase [Clostridia bacterium]